MKGLFRANTRRCPIARGAEIWFFGQLRTFHSKSIGAKSGFGGGNSDAFVSAKTRKASQCFSELIWIYQRGDKQSKLICVGRRWPGFEPERANRGIGAHVFQARVEQTAKSFHIPCWHRDFELLPMLDARGKAETQIQFADHERQTSKAGSKLGKERAEKNE